MAALMAVFRSCMESFKSILTSQEFGEEYELLCAELATQWLRIRLWGESVGLHIDDAGHVQNTLAHRPDIEETITQCVDNIAYLVTEIEALRTKYERRPRLLLEDPPKDHSIQASKSLSTLSDFKRPATSVRQRIRDHQKQKSFLAITRWAMCDARKFDEKVKRLKNLVDGLENISQAAGIALSQPPKSNTSTESPPPYTVDPPTAQRSIDRNTGRLDPPTEQQDIDRDNVGHIDSGRIIPSRASVVLDAGILAHHVALKRFIGLPQDTATARSERGRSRLQSLSDHQFKELRTDVYDEMVRRSAEHPPFLPKISDFHPKRNQAREKLATLPLHRFQDLTSDVVHELERRFTSLQMQVIDELERMVLAPPTPSLALHRASGPRYGRVDPHSPPPLLRHRVSHPAMLIRPPGSDSEPSWPLPSLPRSSTEGPVTSRYSSAPSRTITNSTMTSTSTSTQTANLALSSHPLSPPPTNPVQTTTISFQPTTPRYTSDEIFKKFNVSSTPPSTPDEIFKSFRVAMNDPTYKVLPAALRKYHISGSWENYALYIMYGDKERCLTLDEKPLLLFQQLDKEGKKPRFMLKKIASKSPVVGVEGGEEEEEMPEGDA